MRALRLPLALAVVSVLLVGVHAAPARPPAPARLLVYASVRNTKAREPFDPGLTDLFVVRADGTGFRRLTGTAFAERDPAWSPNGRLIAYSQGDVDCHAGSCDSEPLLSTIWLMAPDGTRQHPLVDADPDAEDVLEKSPSWSPDGRKIAFVRSDKTDGLDPRNGIYVATVGGGRARISRARVRMVVWAPRGSLIAYASKSGAYVAVLDTATRRSRRLRISGLSSSISSVDWSPSGGFLAITTGRAVFVAPASGGKARKVAAARGADGVSWSADGRLVFSARPSGRRARADIYTVAVRGGPVRRLTRNRGADVDPSWRP